MDQPQGKTLFLAARIAIFVVMICAASSCNPFAPKLDESGANISFGDPHTIPGFFEAFKYAYEFKDTTLYGTLIDPQFTFSYTNYDRGIDITWGRDDEMHTTAALFESAEQLTLLWGNVLDSSGTATSYDVTESFSLDVTFNPGDIDHTDGRAIFHLERPNGSAPWKAVRWRDESNL